MDAFLVFVLTSVLGVVLVALAAGYAGRSIHARLALHLLAAGVCAGGAVAVFAAIWALYFA